jgi:Uma2 family endonuclease
MSEQVQLPLGPLTVDEFLPWATAQPRGRFELDAGEVVAMAPERGRHIRAKFAAANALANAIRAAGLPCEALPDGAGVRVDDSTLYQPDAVVTCGARMGDDDLLVPDPIIIVEVTSPSTSRVDLSTKLLDYFRLPSIQHYVVIHLVRRLVLHHRRVEEGRIVTHMLPSGPITLDPPGLTLQAEDLFGS